MTNVIGRGILRLDPEVEALVQILWDFFMGLNNHMKNKIFLIIVWLLFLMLQPSRVVAAKQAESSAMLTNEALGIQKQDYRSAILKEFLEGYNSPLAEYADVFVQTADKYQIDWRLVPAISGVESTFGKHIPMNSFNAYGWCNGDYSFKSWEESIEIVSSTLKKKYFNRGLDDPYKIGPVYAPPSTTWAGKVDYFMKKMDCLYTGSCVSPLDLTI